MICLFNDVINPILSDMLFEALSKVIEEWQAICIDCYKINTQTCHHFIGL